MFFRAILKMRNVAAFKIQRRRLQYKKEVQKYAEIEQKVDQMKFRNSVKIIQKWIKGTLKLIRAKRSKVNPAVE